MPFFLSVMLAAPDVIDTASPPSIDVTVKARRLALESCARLTVTGTTSPSVSARSESPNRHRGDDDDLDPAARKRTSIMRSSVSSFARRALHVLALALLVLVFPSCWAGDGRPGWMPEAPVLPEWYDAALGRGARAIAIEQPNRPIARGHELVLGTTFGDPTMRAWAAQAKQIDVIEYELVVLHEPPPRAPDAIEARLAPPERPTPPIVRNGLVDGRWAFVLADGTWVLAAMGYVDRIRVLVTRSTPPRLPLPRDCAQLLMLSRPAVDNRPQGLTGPINTSRFRGLEWIVIATKLDGTYVTHAHYTDEDAVVTAPRPTMPRLEEAYQHGAEFYTRATAN